MPLSFRTEGAALRSRAKTVQWTVFSESPSSYAAKVRNLL